MEPIIYQPIGVIRSPFKQPPGTPIQPEAGRGVEGKAELDPAYAEGLKDLDGFSYVILIYHFHRAGPFALQTKPFMDDQPRGVFAMRAPSRPNAIGLSVVRLVEIDGSSLRVRDVDIVDGTPLLDIKPYVPQFDVPSDVRAGREARIGWLAENVHKLSTSRDDGRFTG